MKISNLQPSQEGVGSEQSNSAKSEVGLWVLTARGALFPSTGEERRALVLGSVRRLRPGCVHAVPLKAMLVGSFASPILPASSPEP